jgi:hypothetical protein
MIRGRCKGENTSEICVFYSALYLIVCSLKPGRQYNKINLPVVAGVVDGLSRLVSTEVRDKSESVEAGLTSSMNLGV